MESWTGHSYQPLAGMGLLRREKLSPKVGDEEGQRVARPSKARKMQRRLELELERGGHCVFGLRCEQD